jgi:hypothetical protein
MHILFHIMAQENNKTKTNLDLDSDEDQGGNVHIQRIDVLCYLSCKYIPETTKIDGYVSWALCQSIQGRDNLPDDAFEYASGSEGFTYEDEMSTCFLNVAQGMQDTCRSSSYIATEQVNRIRKRLQ